MADTVGFLVGSGQFVFFDCTVQIFVYRCTGNKPCLASAVHCQAVDIEVGQEVLLKNTVGNHALQIFTRLGIYCAAVRVCVGRKVDFRFIDMQEGMGFADGFNSKRRLCD